MNDESKSSNKRHETEYVDGAYVGNNGTISGLNCEKGTHIVEPNMTPAIFFLPDDCEEGEDFKFVDPKSSVSKDVLPCYIVSNYGRVINIATNKELKPDHRRGYLAYTLAASGESSNKKIQAHRLVLGTFKPVEDMDKLQVNHINMVKTDNYVDKPSEDGTLHDNLEWCTAKENCIHRAENYSPINREIADKLRQYRKEGYSLEYINTKFFPDLKYNTIKYACANKIFKDPDYDPIHIPEPTIRLPKNHRYSDEVVLHIRKLSSDGVKNTEIKEKYYPNIPLGTISDIIRKKVHADI